MKPTSTMLRPRSPQDNAHAAAMRASAMAGINSTEKLVAISQEHNTYWNDVFKTGRMAVCTPAEGCYEVIRASAFTIDNGMPGSSGAEKGWSQWKELRRKLLTSDLVATPWK